MANEASREAAPTSPRENHDDRDGWDAPNDPGDDNDPGHRDDHGDRDEAERPVLLYNEYSGDANAVVQTFRIVGDLVFPHSGANPWPAVVSFLVAVGLSVSAGLFGWVALGRLGSEASTTGTCALAAAALGCLWGAGTGLRRSTRKWRAYRAQDEQYRLNAAAALLARTTAATWKREEKARRLYDPKALPVRWRTVNDPALRDRWPTIRRDGEDTPLALDGRFENILRTFQKVEAHSGRLVILGGPGSGKSVLAARLVRDHLEHRRTREPTRPVAFLLPLSSWDPRTPFSDWIAGRILLSCPRLADMGDTRLPAGLLNGGKVLPVLDGLDELPVGARPRVIKALNDLRGQGLEHVVLTSRRDEYEAALDAAERSLTAAAAIELEPLDAEDLKSFLPLTVDHRHEDGDRRTSKWQRVLDALPGPGTAAARHTDDEAARRRAQGAMLGQALATPLMVAMARAAYSDTAASPSELLDKDDFPDQETVENHLLDQFVTAVYRPLPGGDTATGPPAPRWTPDQAGEWLATLARRLQRLGLREITWWRLSPGVPEAARAALETTALALTLAVTGWLVWGQPPRPEVPPPPYVLAVQAVACLIALLTRPAGTAGTGIAPRRLAVRGRWRSFFAQGALAAAVVLPVGLGLKVTPAVLVALPVLFALRTFVDHAVDVSEAASPRELLRADRRAVLALAPVHALRGEGPSTIRPWLLAWAALGPVLVVTAWHRTGGRDAVGPLIWTVAAVASLAALALLGVAASASWSFTATRVTLATTGQLPWALGAFLEDAHDRGVLRQTGGVYEFRHARLQERLAGGPAPEPAEPRPRRLPPVGAHLVALPVALVALLATSFTPGTPGPYAFAELHCPVLDIPANYTESEDKTDENTYSCSWSGETDPDSAPLVEGSGWLPIRDTDYVGYYGLSLFITVMGPQTSRSAVDVSLDLYDLTAENFGAGRAVAGLGQEGAVTDGLVPAYAVTRVGNVVITAMAVDSRPLCRSTVEDLALAQARAALGELGLSDEPPAAATAASWCEADQEDTGQEETVSPSPTPPPTEESPSPTPSETAEESPAPTELRIDKDGTETSYWCRGGAVDIYADEVRVGLGGTCSSVTIHGDRNSVRVQNPEDIQVMGEANVVWCDHPAEEILDLTDIALGKPATSMFWGCRG
ncbi:NACHT domain-containing protein [Streptomyces sp. YU58]|uniref:NACHT domain-containing protein n=1 Tax=Streptomyces sp. SX92 TaxID=3158972 RepID=UPI0027BAA8C7|nr:NACHT domain-containing protein [Streptomyces coralus]WLW53334.1 NACHT domain-containing protein [Streptomyces coralus]